MKKGKPFGFYSKQSCVRLALLCAAIIFVSSFFAQLVQSNLGKVKIEPISIDARGAELDGELYYPAGTTSHDSLPAVIVNHGGGCTYGTMKNMAEEIARRGFVVLNVSAYGSGMSAQPDYDDAEQGLPGFYSSVNVTDGVKSELPAATPMGMTDALDFVRSLEFVDSTRIGMVGHSMGAYRTNAAAILDCGYLSLNDCMMNILADEFGISLTREEIDQDADQLAREKLNTDQLAHYESLRAIEEERYNTRLKAAIILGIGASTGNDPQPTEVAGYEVKRSLQTNLFILSGEFDAAYNLGELETAQAAWYTSEPLNLGEWYIVDDSSETSVKDGTLFDDAASETLTQSFDERTSRLWYLTEGETHSKEFFSTKTNAAVIEYFSKTLGQETTLAADSAMWQLRVVCNTIALFAMIVMILAIAGALLYTPFFAGCVSAPRAEERLPFSKKRFAVFGLITVALSFAAIYYANAKGLFIFGPTKLFPLGRSCSLAIVFVICLAIASAIMLLLNALVGKKLFGSTGLKPVSPAIGVKNVFKCLLLAVIMIAAAYGSLAVMQYFFGQEYRIWMTVFGEMKADYWFLALRYAVVLFPLYLIISAGINFGVRADIPVWKDTLYTVLINSIGIWLCCILNYVIAQATVYDGLFFSSFICSYHMVTVVPITVYLLRRMYKFTNNIWTGAALCAILISWSCVCTLGINDAFYGQTWLGNFLMA